MALSAMEQTVVRAHGRNLLVQDIARTSPDRIGASGLGTSVVNGYVDRLHGVLDTLRARIASGVFPHAAILTRDDDIVEAEAALATLSRSARTIVFLGTGGSSLGGQTLAQLSGWNLPGAADESQKQRPRTRFYDNLDATTLHGALAMLDLATTRFVVISKSGGTSETLVQALAAIDAMRMAGLGAQISSSFLAVSDPAVGGAPSGLRALAAAFGFPVLEHPAGIGGRYSVFSIVGLLPALARGTDVRAFRRGAQAVVDALLAGGPATQFTPAVGAAVAVALARERGIRVNVMMPYTDRLARFSNWYVQLWAESLGKAGHGTTPLAALGPLDQHSQLQLFMDGPKEHFLTIVRTAAVPAAPVVAADLAAIAGVDFMGGRSIGELVAAQAEAVSDALAEASRPVRTLTLDQLDEASLGALMMHMVFETILAADLFGVDPFDQPAVELAKRLTREHLSQPRPSR